jgi:signal transduction histidine kinase/ActR/RegA family two-component response regulator
VRLFAKLPEPGIALPPERQSDAQKLAKMRNNYTDWANRVLFDQLDVVQVIFIDPHGKITLALDRDQHTGLLEQNNAAADLPHFSFLSAGLKATPGTVLTSPISLDKSVDGKAPNRVMTMSFISPLVAASSADGTPELRGVVVFNLDVGGLAHAYRGIFWVQDNGEYLSDAGSGPPGSSAFDDFPGLEALFAQGQLGLWEFGDKQVFWLPLFTVQDSGPLWVGRSVDRSPVVDFIRKLEIRVFIVISVLLLVIYLIARAFAVRAERVSDELIQKMSSVLEEDQPVTFSWKRPEELHVLGDTLTCLAEKHAEDTRALRDHAQALEESNRYKSEFLANVSHELRTPLNSILLLSKMLAAQDTGTPETARQQARVIHDAGADLRALIDTILDLSRIEARKDSLKAVNIDLKALLEALSALMRPQFEEKGLQFDLVIDQDAPTSLISDVEKLRQILINFLSNALKFTEKGHIILKLSRNRGSSSGALPVAISVADTGIGIPADKQGQVFEAFKQVDGSTSRRYGGTGLGLTISRQLADLLGGQIRVQSILNSGSTFTLLLPHDMNLEAPADDEASRRSGQAATMTPAQSSDIPAADYHGRRILLVDDDIRNLLALTPVLEKWTVAVVAAGDGREALETLQEDKEFDLILMDLMMPDLDGFETIRHIKDDPATTNIPVIALTAKTTGTDRQLALDCGARDFLTKPVDPSALKAALDRHLGDTPVREQS